MELNEKIKRLRVQKSLTQKELGHRVGVSEISVGCWETGIKKPSVQKIVLLSRVLEVSVDYLLGTSFCTSSVSSLLTESEKLLIDDYRTLDKYGQKVVRTVCKLERSRVEEPEQSKEITPHNSNNATDNTRMIPKYLTPIAAGYSVPIDDDEFEMIAIDASVHSNADFAVIISGNSMFPYINDGDVVYVKRTCQIDIGDVGVFCVDGAMYCKQYHVDTNGNLTLVSANPELQGSNVKISADSGSKIVCYGKVLLGKRIAFPKYFTSR